MIPSPDRQMEVKTPARSLAGLIGRMVQFGAVGLSGMVVDYGTFYALMSAGLRDGPTIGPIHFLWANMLSVAFAIQNNFFWNRRWTFADRRNATVTRQWRYFTVFSVMTWLLNNVIVGTFEGLYGRGAQIAVMDAQIAAVYVWKAIAIALCVLLNFALSTRVAFR